MANFDHIVEILLRLVRGERATPNQPNFLYGQSQVLSSPLASALAPGSPHASQQTHVSLAVLSMFRMAVEYGGQAGVEKEVIEGRVGDMVRSLPQHLLYKSLDGMFREWLGGQRKPTTTASSSSFRS